MPTRVSGVRPLAAVCVLMILAASPAAGQPSHGTTLVVERPGPLAAEVGEVAKLRFRVRNSGSADAEQVTVGCQLPAEVTVLGAKPVPDVTGRSLRWRIDRVAAGKAAEFEVRLRVKPGAADSFDYRVTADYRSAARDEASVSVRQKVVIGIDGPALVQRGRNAPIDIRVTNTSDKPLADVMLKASLDEGLTHPGGPRIGHRIGELRPGQSRTIRLDLTPHRVGKLAAKLTATAGGADVAARDAAVECVDVRVKAEAHGPSVSYLGWPCTFNYIVRNTSDRPTPTLAVRLELPDGLEASRISPPATGDAGGKMIAWSLPPMKPGESRVVMIDARAKQPGTFKGRIRIDLGKEPVAGADWSVQVQPATEGGR